jgi:hypothetical protein
VEGSIVSDQTSIAQALQEVTDRAQVLVREEIELAKAEVSQKAAKLAKGAVVAAAAGGFVLGALVMLLFGFAELAWWAIPFPSTQKFWAYFTVAAILLALAGLAGWLAARAFKAGSPPAPTMAIDEAKRIRETVQSEHPEATV